MLSWEVKEAMMLLAELKFSEARSTFTNVIDRVQGLFPLLIQPRKQSEEYTFLMKEALVQQLLDGYKFEIRVVQEDEGSLYYWVDTLDLYGCGETPEEAINSLVEDVLIYAKQYLDNPARYFNAPNRRHHLPYMLKITLCNNAEEVKQMLLQDAPQV